MFLGIGGNKNDLVIIISLKYVSKDLIENTTALI